jgi:hypothetical protein
MIAKRILGLAAASALLVWSGQAGATIFTLDLSGATPTFSSNDSGGVHTVRYDFSLSGFPDVAPTVQIGDEVIINLTFADGAITLPATSFIDVTSFYVTGDGFPAGDSATYGTTTLFSGGIGGTVVASGSEGDPIHPQGTTTSGGVASNQVFGSPPAFTFDAVRTDFFIADIDGPGHSAISGPLDRASFSVDSRSLDAVPEPASWALMLIGFGGMGGVLRTLRRKAFA